MTKSMNQEKENIEQATFGAGCFWCVEALFESIKGIKDVQSGYTGGHIENPSYKSVCTGNTGHAEVVNFKFIPTIISFKNLLEIFWGIHDPTTLNRQGGDVGSQYRSAIFYHNENQRILAEKSKIIENSSNKYVNNIVTEILPFKKLYLAEEYHQNYYTSNPDAPYCRMIIKKKLDKLKISKKY